MDIGLCILALTFMYLFLFGSNDGHFSESYIADLTHTDQVMSEVETDVVLLLLPNIIMVFIKTLYGVRWLRLDYKRSAYQTYYMTSQSFYTSFVVQETMIIYFSWNVFNVYFRYLQIWSVVACFGVYFFMRMQMKFLDKQNKAINVIRRDAAKKRHY